MHMLVFGHVREPWYPRLTGLLPNVTLVDLTSPSPPPPNFIDLTGSPEPVRKRARVLDMDSDYENEHMHPAHIYRHGELPPADPAHESDQLAMDRIDRECSYAKGQLDLTPRIYAVEGIPPIVPHGHNNESVSPRVEMVACTPHTLSFEARPHQLDFCNAFLGHEKTHKGAIAVHQVGTGKTFLAALVAQVWLSGSQNRRVLVSCPKSVVSQFTSKLREYGLAAALESKHIIVINHHGAYTHFEWVERHDTLLVVDEAHMMRTQVGEELDDDNSRRIVDVHRRLSMLAKKLILMTATPMINSVADIHNLVAFAAGDMQHSGAMPCMFSFFDDSRGNPRYPQNVQYYNVYIPFTSEMCHHYVQTEIALEKQHKPPRGTAGGRDSKSLKAFLNGLRKLSSVWVDANKTVVYKAKLNWVVGKIRANPSSKFLVYWESLEQALVELHSDLVQTLGAAKVRLLDGSTSLAERGRIVDDYNDKDNECRVLLITAAGCAGLDLKMTRYVIIVAPSWNYGNSYQAIGRAIRYDSHADTISPQVTVYRLIAVKPYEFANLDAVHRRIASGDTEFRHGDMYASVDVVLECKSRHKQQTIINELSRIREIATLESPECNTVHVSPM